MEEKRVATIIGQMHLYIYNNMISVHLMQESKETGSSWQWGTLVFSLTIQALMRKAF